MERGRSRWRASASIPPTGWSLSTARHRQSSGRRPGSPITSTTRRRTSSGRGSAPRLDIPYLVAEASHAPKRAGGSWAKFHGAAQDAIAKADAIFSLNPADAECLKPVVAPGALLAPLKPFLDGADFAAAGMRRDAIRTEFARRFGMAADRPWLLTVAMMREGDKYSSYRVLGHALQQLTDQPWQLLVVGDGPARKKVEEIFGPLAQDRVRFAGARLPEELPDFYGAADLFVWPAINEAYGMSLLEAQAAGLPVIAGAVRRRAVDRHPRCHRPADVAGRHRRLRRGAARIAAGCGAAAAPWAIAALEIVAGRHDVASAAATLDSTLRDVVARRRRKAETLRQA